MNHCYLSDDFTKNPPPSGTILSPEGLLNAGQIAKWCEARKKCPLTFASTSLYLIRELYLRQVPVTWHCTANDRSYETQDINDLGPLECLDRELEQADRYMNHELDLEIAELY